MSEPSLATCGRAGCGRAAVAVLPYSGQRLCGEDFVAFFERRAKRELRKQGPFPSGSVIAVGLSGGKDSVVALHLLHGVFASRRDVRLVAVSVDEGIAGYRPASLEVAHAAAKSLDVPHEVVSYRELAGRDLDVLVAESPATIPCAMCGPLRRRALNDAARKVGATHLATGHNLDDQAQTVLMNVLKGEVDRLARLAPHERPVPGLVPRILPLRTIPEREVALYAILKGYAFHDGDCPYAARSDRGRVRDLLLALEEERPGTRHALLAVQDRVAELTRGAPAPELPACASCGEPTSGDVCQACRVRRGDA